MDKSEIPNKYIDVLAPAPVDVGVEGKVSVDVDTGPDRDLWVQQGGQLDKLINR